MKEDRFNVPDELWSMVEKIIPKKKKSSKGGRPSLDDRRVLAGVIYRLRTGISWHDLPPMYGAKSSVHKRFQEWVDAGVFDKIYKHILKYYNKKKGIRTKRMAADGSYSRAPKGGLTQEQIQQTVVNSLLKNIS